MTRAPLILSLGVADAALSAPAPAARLIELVERAGIDLLLLGDGASAAFDPLVVASWLAPRTRRVGLVPTLSTGRDLPFHVARALSALDFLTQGRAGWQPSTLARPAIGQPTIDTAIAQGIDFVAATRSLWDSWDDDALIIDPPSGRYLDSRKVRRNDHRGPYFRVLGPLNAARPPQGHPVLVQSDADPIWSQVAPDIVVTDRASPAPSPGPKRLLRVGTARAGLDEIEAWYRAGAIDGIHLHPPDAPVELEEFVTSVLPALIFRGMIPATGASGTLRARLGLTRPTHAFSSVPLASRAE